MWVKVDDGFSTHPKVLQAGPVAAFTFICCLCYSARHLTDGFVPAYALAAFPVPDATGDVERLINAGLMAAADGGFQVIAFLEYNLSKAQVESYRARAKRGAHARWHANKDASSMPEAMPVPMPEAMHVPSSIGALPRKEKTSKQGTRCPEPFTVTEAMQEWARSEAPRVDWRKETNRFVDYWRAIPGQRGVKLDWQSTWRNWIRKAAEQ